MGISPAAYRRMSPLAASHSSSCSGAPPRVACSRRRCTIACCSVAVMSGTLGGPEAPRRAFAGLPCLCLAIARGRIDRQRVDQPPRGGTDFFHGGVERGLVGSRGVGSPAELPHELQWRRTNLLVGRRRREIGERFDVPAHVRIPGWEPREYIARLSSGGFSAGRPTAIGRAANGA